MRGEKSDYLPQTNTNGNFITDFKFLNQNLMSSLKCKKCDRLHSIEICEKSSNMKDMAVLLV